MKVVWVVKMQIGPIARKQRVFGSSGSRLETAIQEQGNGINELYIWRQEK